MLNFDNFKVLTFDCYGTLIDWETGIWQILQPILDHHQVSITSEQALELYGELEAQAESGPYQDYKTILKTVLKGFGLKLGFVPSQAELERFSHSVKDWPPFPDSAPALQALKKKYKLAIISNVDDDLFEFSARRLQTAFDWVITAQQVKSYKPSFNNFRFAFEKIGVPTDEILHVAQSLFHDIVPANALGVSTVWVNRRYNKPGFGATPPAQAQANVEVPDLQSLAAMTGVL